MNLHEMFSRKPQPGTVKITDSHGTTVYQQPRTQSGHFSGPPPKWEGAEFYQLVGQRLSYRSHFRVWFKQAWADPGRHERTAHDMPNVSKNSLKRFGPVVLHLNRYGYSKEQDVYTMFEYAAHLPLVSLRMTVKPPELRAGVLDLALPDFRLYTSTPSRPSLSLMLGLAHLWNYPWGNWREWGFSVGQISQKRFLLMVANPSEGSTEVRWSFLWLFWNRKAQW